MSPLNNEIDYEQHIACTQSQESHRGFLGLRSAISLDSAMLFEASGVLQATLIYSMTRYKPQASKFT